jgi:hypothetical protein
LSLQEGPKLQDTLELAHDLLRRKFAPFDSRSRGDTFAPLILKSAALGTLSALRQLDRDFDARSVYALVDLDLHLMSLCV